MKKRCEWSIGNTLYEQYHDTEWGVPAYNDQVHFEFLVLESAQAGLSWITILKKRENYRKAYHEFDPRTVSDYNQEKIEELLQNPGIVRNRKKIEASVNNAKCFIAVQEEYGSFSKYIWSFVGHEPIQNHWTTEKEIPAKTTLSIRLAKDMKRRGFQFLGPTILYSHMQATGLINDHVKDCYRFQEINERSAERKE